MQLNALQAFVFRHFWERTLLRNLIFTVGGLYVFLMGGVNAYVVLTGPNGNFHKANTLLAGFVFFALASVLMLRFWKVKPQQVATGSSQKPEASHKQPGGQMYAAEYQANIHGLSAHNKELARGAQALGVPRVNR